MEVKRRTARSLVQRLSSSSAGSATAAEALAEIRRLSKHDPEIRALLADAGAVPLLVTRLLDHPHHQENYDDAAAESQENAAAALLNLSISAREAVMSTPGILDALASALRLPSHGGAVAQHAAMTVYSLLSIDAYRPIIGSKRSLVAALVDLLRAPDAPTRSIKDALKALFGVALYPLNRAAVVELGAVPPLFALVVKDGRTGVVEDATAVISQVAGCYESVEAFRRVAGVAILVELVDAATGASGRTRENAAAALLNLVMSGGDKAVGDVMEVEGAEAAVRELASDDAGVSARGKSKAEALLRVLQSQRQGLGNSETGIDSSGTQTLHYSSSYSNSIS
ncbi:U-box domain-containing protein 4-like [Canna indica]|uniref:U-box domain-containing protein 4-like n=1 Tax=Canna indica TaxID=4628 RepID=A0AAQ3JZJ0_9LILI|nr:U-box domain-containing protein 4-like [Canna indica]